MNVLITGGTGMIGQKLTSFLSGQYHVTILTRNKALLTKNSANIRYAYWNVEDQKIDKDAIAQADHIVHLAGASIAEKRWSASRKEEIRKSRIKSSELLVQAVASTNNHIKSVISASAIGWYGSDNEHSKQHGFTENDKSSNDFLGETCQLWENSVAPFEQLGKRLVKIRTGLVLNGKGFLEALSKPLKAGIAPIFGSGEQIISWIHLDDIIRVYRFAIENEILPGSYNAVAPMPVSDKKLTLAYAISTKGKSFIPIHIPEFALKLLLGELGSEVLKSTTVNNQKLKATGFQFLYPTIEAVFPPSSSGD